MVLLAWGRSHRTSADGELIRWGTDLARVEGVRRRRHDRGRGHPVGRQRRGRSQADPGQRPGSTGERAGRPPPGRRLRARGDAPDRRLAVAPSRRHRPAGRVGGRRPTPTPSPPTAGPSSSATACSAQIREEGASRDELRFWDGAFLDSGGAIVAERRRLLEVLAEPLAAAHAEIAPDEAAAARLGLRYVTNAPALPGETPRAALARRLLETADKEVWNGSTLVGPHRDDLAFELGGSRPGRLRLAWPAADGDPGLQARRAGRPDGPRRPAAAPAPRRRLLGARSGPAFPSRPPDRRAAPVVRHDNDARRPGSGAARDRHGLGGPPRGGRGEPRRCG